MTRKSMERNRCKAPYDQPNGGHLATAISSLKVSSTSKAECEEEHVTRSSNGKSMADSVSIHECYQEAVQAVRKEVVNIFNIYMEIRDTVSCPPPVASDDDPADRGAFFHRRIPLVLREDFCGTAILCREWVSRGIMRSAIGIDLNEETIEYARSHDPDGLFDNRIKLIVSNVLNISPDSIENADILVAFNYSICYFHRYRQLVDYLAIALRSVAPGGIFICDLFGESSKMSSRKSTFSRKHSTFTYSFERSPIDIITNTCHCHIHFHFIDGSVKARAFSYHFRMWTIAEVIDAMIEVGFRKVEVWLSTRDNDSCSGKEDDGTLEYERILTIPVGAPKGCWNAYIVGVA